MLTRSETKELISTYRAQFAASQYEKFKDECYGIENAFDDTKDKDIQAHLHFAEIGIDLDDPNECVPTFINHMIIRYLPVSSVTAYPTPAPTPPSPSTPVSSSSTYTAISDSTFSYTFTEGKILDKVLLLSDDNQVVNIGTTSGGSQLIDDWEIPTINPQPISLGHYFQQGETVYITGLTSSSTITLYFQ